MSLLSTIHTQSRPFEFPRRAPRVLHLVRSGVLSQGSTPTSATDGGGDGLILACRALVSHDHDSIHTTIALGGHAARTHCGALGLTIDYTVPLPSPGPQHLAWLNSRRVRRLIRATGPYDVVMCWGRDLIEFADAATRTLLPTPRLLCWPPLAHQGDRAPVPAVVPRGDRAAMRAELGLSDHDRVCLLLSDPPSLGDANGLVYVLGLLENAREPFLALAHAGSCNMARARSVVRSIGLRTRVIQSDAPLFTVLPVCDLALVLPSSAYRSGARRELAGYELPAADSQRVLAASALSLGIPVVVPRGVGMDDLLSEAGSECLIESYRNAHMARAMLCVCPQVQAMAHAGVEPASVDSAPQVHVTRAMEGFDLRGPGVIPPTEFAASISREWTSTR